MSPYTYERLIKHKLSALHWENSGSRYTTCNQRHCIHWRADGFTGRKNLSVTAERQRTSKEHLKKDGGGGGGGGHISSVLIKRLISEILLASSLASAYTVGETDYLNSLSNQHLC